MDAYNDYLQTPSHHYPRWIIFPDVNKPVLALRTVIGQDCCDAAIRNGWAIPVAKRHNSVAGAMHALTFTHPDLSHKFFEMISKPSVYRQG